MRARFLWVCAIALSALAVTVAVGGAQRGGAASGVYQPPPGWHRTQALARGLGVWVYPAGDQSISVQATRFDGRLSDFARLQATQIQGLPDAKLGAMQRTTVCNNHPAVYFTYAATVNQKPLLFEQMATLWSGMAYLATYTRPSKSPSIRAARSSLTTLCGGFATIAAPRKPTAVPVATAAPATPFLGPSQAPQTFGPVAPTVTPGTGPP